jgi:DNA (cytosine-5)-methyltransferase 1
MGWEAAFFSEIEKFPCAVLEHRYPDVPLHGDFTTIKENEYGTIDLLVGGTPCQSFSIAGMRGGLDDDRGNLALEFCRLAQREKPRWIVWENVPGVLSSSGGRDFGSILGALEDLGYGIAYRVLDAQYFGVAQRRRRVFVVGYLGDWRPAAAVLFERHSMSGHPAPSREKRQEATDTAATGTGDSSGNGRGHSNLDTFECGGIGSYSSSDNSSPLLRTGADLGPGCEALIASTFNEDGTARTLTARYDGSPCVDRGPDVVGTLRAHHPGTAGVQSDTDHIIAVDTILGNSQLEWPAEIAPTLNAAFSDKQGLENQHINGGAGWFVPTVAFSSNMSVPDCQTDGTTPTLKLSGHGGGNPPAVAFEPAIAWSEELTASVDLAGTIQRGGSGGRHDGVMVPTEIYQDSEFGVQAYDQAGTLRAGRIPAHQMTLQQSTVRRLTPVECERLQGFPDNFTAIPWRKKGAEDCPDGPRYKALGNSMAVPVMRWIGERIQMIEDMKK